MTILLVLSAFSTIFSASLEEVAIGFSIQTCFPFSRASIAKEKCEVTGVVMITTSISGARVTVSDMPVTSELG